MIAFDSERQGRHMDAYAQISICTWLRNHLLLSYNFHCSDLYLHQRPSRITTWDPVWLKHEEISVTRRLSQALKGPTTPWALKLDVQVPIGRMDYVFVSLQLWGHQPTARRDNSRKKTVSGAGEACRVGFIQAAMYIVSFNYQLTVTRYTLYGICSLQMINRQGTSKWEEALKVYTMVPAYWKGNNRTNRFSCCWGPANARFYIPLLSIAYIGTHQQLFEWEETRSGIISSIRIAEGTKVSLAGNTVDKNQYMADAEKNWHSMRNIMICTKSLLLTPYSQAMSNKSDAFPTLMFRLMFPINPGKLGVTENRRATAARQF